MVSAKYTKKGILRTRVLWMSGLSISHLEGVQYSSKYCALRIPHRVHILVEMKQGQCICPLSWSVHSNFSGEGKCNERGWACTPHPHQPGQILPSSLNVRQKATVATLCTLWNTHCPRVIQYKSGKQRRKTKFKQVFSGGYCLVCVENCRGCCFLYSCITAFSSNFSQIHFILQRSTSFGIGTYLLSIMFEMNSWAYTYT